MLRRSVVLVAMFSRGEVGPFLQLGREARAAGLDVTLVTHAGYRAEAEAAELRFATWDTVEEHAALAADAGLFSSLKGFGAIYATHVVPTLERQVGAIDAACAADAVIVTVASPALAARIVADRRGLPLVTVAFGPGYLSAPATMVSMLADHWPAIDAVRSAHGAPALADREAWLARATMTLCLWPPWFGTRLPHWPAPEQLAFTGFLAAPAATPSAAPCRILIACGTGRYLTPELVERCVVACRALAPTALVTPERALVPAALAPAIHFDRLPYAQILPAVDLIVHHGGIGTMVEALRAGVPQLIVGSGSDRPLNASIGKRLGIAAYLPPLRATEDAISAAATALMTPEVRAHCESVAARARQESSRATEVLVAYADGAGISDNMMRS